MSPHNACNLYLLDSQIDEPARVWRFDWLDEVPDGNQIAGERWDGTSVIHDSGWIPSTARGACKHYRLNFNECGGRLDVACESFEVDAKP